MKRGEHRLQQVDEVFRVQHPVAKVPVAEPAPAVLPRRVQVDAQCLNLCRLQGLPKPRGDELRGIAADATQHAAQPDRHRPKIASPIDRHRTLNLKQHRLAGDLADQR